MRGVIATLKRERESCARSGASCALRKLINRRSPRRRSGVPGTRKPTEDDDDDEDDDGNEDDDARASRVKVICAHTRLSRRPPWPLIIDER